MGRKAKNSIIKYDRNKRKHVKLGIILTLIMTFYMFIMIYHFMMSRHIKFYEVREGSLAVDNTYRGIILRTEKVFNSGDNGYISYYAREGERVPKGGLIYTIDESGKLGNIINGSDTGTYELTENDLNELKTQIISYKNTYSDKNFDSVYDFKFSIEGTVNKLSNQNILTNLNQISDRSVLDLVNYGYSPESGIIIYSTDGFENLATADINDDCFDEEAHPKQQLTSNSLISSGDPAYKLITEDKWSIVIEIDDKRKEELENENYVQVGFIKNDTSSWGKINLFDNGDKHFCRLDFTNSMINFATERYMDIELLINPNPGLKIPITSKVQKSFYLVPKEYILGFQEDSDEKSSNASSSGNEELFVSRKALDEEGKPTIEKVKVSVYYTKDNKCYIDKSILRYNDKLIHPDTNKTFSVAEDDTLIGVYNMNKGYADFTRINVLYENNEYAIVQSENMYSLKVYDRIVLDGNTVTDDDFVFE